METKIKVGDERKQEFDRDLRYDRQKDYKIDNYELVPAMFKECGDRVLYKNFNFSIFVDDYCNADCQFCVAHARYTHVNLAYQKPRIFDEQKYLERLEEVLKIIRPYNPSVSLTGGEPTLSKNLVNIMRLIDKYDFRKRTITTNGTKLFEIYEGKTILEHLIENKFDYINISRAHYDHDKNNYVMRITKETNEVNYKDAIKSDEFFTKILETIKNHNSNLRPRLSCLLCKEGVSNVTEMKNYMDHFSKLGYDNFIFREIMSFESQTKNDEIGKYCEDQRIDLVDIWEDLEKEKDFKPWMNLVGYYYYVEIYKYRDNITMASEAADINVQYQEKNNNKHMIYETVFHPNGNLCGSWVDNEDILDKYIE